MQPQISVIVPIYKAEEHLRQCIDSILAQTFTGFELILVNDGSPDNCGAICDEYALKDERIKVIHKQNGGVSSARNAGINVATGKWITFIDADDYIERNFLDIPLDATEDLLIQNYEVFNDESDIQVFGKSTVNKSDISQFIDSHLHESILRTPWAKFFKASIIKCYNIQFPHGITVGEDALFVQEYLYYTQSVQYISSAKYIYRSNCDYSRYNLPTEKALDIFHRFIANYEKLDARSILFLDFAFNWHWGLIAPQKPNRKKRVWYNDKIVKKVYKTIHKHKNLKWRIAYNLYKILS